MNLWEMILGVVLIGAIATTLQAYVRGRGPRELEAAQDPDTRRLTEEVRALRERVAVLERIATDRNHSLEQEFERLRKE